jgi:steroid delta-isomerase-like uncharacterized protein
MARTTQTREDIAAFVETHAEAFSRHDPVTLASHHALDGVVVSPIFATVRGRPAIEDSYRALFTAFPDWTFHVEDVIIDGRKLVVLFKTTATHTSDFFGLPGTNKRFEISGARCITLEDGLIAHERRIYDFTGLLIQVGVLRAKPGKP